MTRVVFLCGPAGAGKSFLARGLERDGLVRLSIDDEAWRRGFRTMPLPDEVADGIERALRCRLLGLVRDGTDVVLDLSFWSRRLRADYRALLVPLGVVPETVHVDTPREIALARVGARGPGEFRLAPEVAAAFHDHFEAPTAEEGPLTVVSGVSPG